MSKAIAEYRKARSVELALAGLSYDEIARQVGYAIRGTAHRTVSKALRERVDEAVVQLRQVELDRLNRLQAAAWPAAMTGDVAAANTILRVMEQRARLLGLYSPSEAVTQPRTLVLAESKLGSQEQEATREATAIA